MMESIEKLRESLKDCTSEAGVEPNRFDTYWITARACDMLIDEIEREIAEKYMLLPTDMDDEPIHIGDEMQMQHGQVGKVVAVGETQFTVLATRKPNVVCQAKCHRHVKARAIEDVLDSYEQSILCARTEHERELVRRQFADELNAELGGGSCARCAEDMGRYADSLCDPLKERIAELLRCLENDWHIHASWDGLRKFWCIELTEEGVRVRDAMHGTLTTEQVSNAVYAHSIHADCADADWQAIADELNARAERTCECVSEYAESPFDGKTIVLHRCSACHELMRPHMRYCPNCGRKVSA